MQITKHAKDRMKQRCGFNKKAVNRMAEKALTDGIPHKKTKGQLNKWITSLYFYSERANNIRIYGDKAYIFRDDRLITVIQVPPSLRKNIKSMVEDNKSE